MVRVVVVAVVVVFVAVVVDVPVVVVSVPVVVVPVVDVSVWVVLVVEKQVGSTKYVSTPALSRKPSSVVLPVYSLQSSDCFTDSARKAND